MNGLNMEYLGCIPHDQELDEMIFAGRSLYELGDSVATLRMNTVMEKLGA